MPPWAWQGGRGRRAFDAAISLGGTVTGEHGVGLVKSAQLAKQLSPAASGSTARSSSLFDPKDLLNRGKRSRERRTPHGRTARSRGGIRDRSRHVAVASHRTVPAYPGRPLLARRRGAGGRARSRCPRAAAGRARRGAGRAGDGRARRARQRRRDRLDDERSRDAARGLGGRLRGQRARDVPLLQARSPRHGRAGGGSIVNVASVAALVGCATGRPTVPRRAPSSRSHARSPSTTSPTASGSTPSAPAPSTRPVRRLVEEAGESLDALPAPGSRSAGSARPRRSPRPSSTSSPRSSRRARCSSSTAGSRPPDGGARRQTGERTARVEGVRRRLSARARRCGCSRSASAAPTGRSRRGSSAWRRRVTTCSCSAMSSSASSSRTGTASRGDLVTAIVRRSCSHCLACNEGAPDSCLTGDYSERGITRLHGFARELVAEDPAQLIDPALPRSAGRARRAGVDLRARSGTHA